jgi:hypothetical protein
MTETDEVAYEQESQPTFAGEMNGTPGGPAYERGHISADADGQYRSVIYWAPDDYWDGPWIASGTLGRSQHEDHAGRIWFNQDEYWVGEGTLYHERGHNLGFRHEDDGLAGGGAEDAADPGLHPTTLTIQEHTEGLELLDWSGGLSALRQAISAWRAGYITLSDMRYCISQWRAGAGHLDLYSDGYLDEILVGADQFDQDVYTGGIYRQKNRTREGTVAWR